MVSYNKPWRWRSVYCVHVCVCVCDDNDDDDDDIMCYMSHIHMYYHEHIQRYPQTQLFPTHLFHSASYRPYLLGVQRLLSCCRMCSLTVECVLLLSIRCATPSSSSWLCQAFTPSSAPTTFANVPPSTLPGRFLRFASMYPVLAL
jgi:hypothetical protein